MASTMRGQAELETMRRAGRVPAMVDICLFPVKPWLIGCSRGSAVLQAKGKPDRAALRCVVGLTVTVSGGDAERVHAMRDACIAAGAKRVIATVFDEREDVPDYERFKAVEVTDTDGVLVWPN